MSARLRDGALALAAAAALAVALAVAAGVWPAVRFARERIELELGPDSLRVDGRYEYENPWPVALVQGLSVPFAQGDGQAAPAGVGAWLVEPQGERELPVRWVLGLPRIEVRVPARGRAVLRVRFEQRCTAGRGTYLLTTTRPWGRALEAAEYVVRTRGVTLDSSSLPLAPGAGESVCLRRDFFPAEDWRLSWTATPSPAR